MLRAALLSLLLSLTFAQGCAAPQGHLRILHTTDLHGHLSDGLVGVSDLVDAARSEPVEVLLVDSGDMWSGTLMSDRNEGALGVAAYNALGYDAVAVGNHEFDYGPVGPERTGGEDPFEALKIRLTEASFPVLSANLVDKATGERPAWENLHATTMIRRGGFQVGIVGLTTEETASITFPHVGNALSFENAAHALTREAEKLRSEGADLIIAIAHIGGVCDSLIDPDDLSTCDDDSELFNLIRAQPKGLIDIALGGHTHKRLAHRVNGVVVAHAGAHGEELLELEVSGTPGALDITIKAPLSTEVKREVKGPSRRALDGVLREAIASQQAQREERLGAKILRPLTRDMQESSPLGTFLCDVLMQLHPEHEVCLLNSGGIRAEVPAGDMTYGQLYDVMPFGNYAASVALSGEALIELLRLGTAGAHGVIQVGGLSVRYDPGKVDCGSYDRDGDGTIGAGDRDRLIEVLGPEGAPIDPKRTYHLITNSFLASGGDSWRKVITSLPKGSVRVLDHLLPIREQVGAWLREKRPILNSEDQPVMTQKRVQMVTTNKAPADARCGK